MNNSDTELLQSIARANRQFANGIITAQELMWKFTDSFASHKVSSSLASQIVALMPDSVRLLCRDWIITVLAPDYRKAAWAGISYANPEAQAATSAILTARVKEWAETLQMYLEILPGQAT